MSRARTIWLLGGVLALVASGLSAAETDAERSARTEELRQAELAFAASVADDDAEKFAGLIAEDAVFVSGATAIRGRAAVVESWQGFFGPDRALLEWHPELVELAGDGSLGLTRGPWTLRGEDATGNEIVQSGTFNSVWRRLADGSWRIVFDAGCSPCPRCE